MVVPARTRLPSRVLLRAVPVLAAILAGGAIATQPLPTAILLIGVGALGVLAMITPFTALIAVLVLAPMRTLIATEASFQLPLDIGQITLVALLGVWAVHKIAARHPLLRVTWTPIYIPLLGYAVVIGLNAFNAASLGTWLIESLKWAVILLAVVLALNMGIHNRRWEWIVFGLTLAGVANAIVGIYIFFGGSGADHLLINNRFFRAFGTFGQPNPFGGFMGILAPVALMAAYGHTLRLWRIWRATHSVSTGAFIALVYYFAASGLIILALLFSWSRGAWLGLGVTFMVLVLAAPFRLRHGIAAVLLIGLIGGVLWTTGRLPATIVDRIGSATQELFVLTDVRAVNVTAENYAIVERLAHWQAAINMATESPFLGVGLGNYEVVYDQYRLISWTESLGHAHNYYLNVLAETGIIGLAAYLSIFIMLAWMTWYTTRVHPDPLGRSIAVGLLGSWIYILVHSLTDHLYVNNVFIHFGFLIGIMAILYREISTTMEITILPDAYGNS